MKRLTVYVDEKDKLHHKPVYEAVLDILHEGKIAGASIFRGIGGFGADGVVPSTKILELSSDLPIRIEAVDSEEKIERILPQICHAVEKGLVTVSDTLAICSRKPAMMTWRRNSTWPARISCSRDTRINLLSGRSAAG